MAVSHDFSMEPYVSSGFIGLAPKSDNTEIPSLLDQMTGNNTKLPRLFSLYLSNNPLYHGALIFGDYDLKRYSRFDDPVDIDIDWVKVSSNGHYWNSDIAFMQVGSNNISINSSRVVFDSGMSTALMIKSDVEAIVQEY